MTQFTEFCLDLDTSKGVKKIVENLKREGEEYTEEQIAKAVIIWLDDVVELITVDLPEYASDTYREVRGFANALHDTMKHPKFYESRWHWATRHQKVQHDA